MLRAQQETHPIGRLEPAMELSYLLASQDAVRKVFVHEAVRRYLQQVAAATRRHPHALFGASPRGSLALMRMAQALAAIRGASFVLPDHVKEVAHPVLAHRVVVRPRSHVQGVDGDKVVTDVLQQVPVPVDYAV
jgi:MoxR-like ATPase